MERSLVVIDTKPSHSRGVLSAFTLLLWKTREAKTAPGTHTLYSNSFKVGRGLVTPKLGFNGMKILLGFVRLTRTQESSLLLSTSTGWIGTKYNFQVHP